MPYLYINMFGLGEEEVILPRGQKMEITEVTDSEIVVELIGPADEE